MYNSFAQTKKCPICGQTYDYEKIELDKRLEREINELKYICNSCDSKVKFILYVQMNKNIFGYDYFGLRILGHFFRLFKRLFLVFEKKKIFVCISNHACLKLCINQRRLLCKTPNFIYRLLISIVLKDFTT